MEQVQVIFRLTPSGKQYKCMLNDDDVLSSIDAVLKREFGIPDSIKTLKYIYAGKKLDSEKKVKDCGITPDAVIVVIAPPEIKNATEISKFDILDVHLLAPCFLAIVRSNPTLMTLMNRDVTELMKFMLTTPEVFDIVRDYVPKAKEIAEKIKNGEQVNIIIPKITGPAPRFGTGVSSFVPHFIDEHAQPQVPVVALEDLSVTDKANIDRIIGMGFTRPPDEIIKLYIESGKNVDITVDKLL
jgi:hypothetical protein